MYLVTYREGEGHADQGGAGQGHITENFDGKSYLIHQIRRRDDGSRELRSRFWLPAPEGVARDLMVHCGMEMSRKSTYHCVFQVHSTYVADR